RRRVPEHEGEIVALGVARVRVEPRPEEEKAGLERRAECAGGGRAGMPLGERGAGGRILAGRYERVHAVESLQLRLRGPRGDEADECAEDEERGPGPFGWRGIHRLMDQATAAMDWRAWSLSRSSSRICSSESEVDLRSLSARSRS